MIVWLASYPRSGNSLYREILWQLCDVPTWSVYNDPEVAQMDFANVIGHQPFYYQDAMEFVLDDEPQFIKTHELAKRPHDHFPAIYIVRDGRDAIVSRTHFTFEFGGDRFGYKDFGGVMAELCRPHDHIVSWNDHVLYWLTQRESKVVIVRYEDLLRDPVGTFLWSIDQLDLLPMKPKNEMIEFEDLHERWPRFFRRGKSGAWKDEMPIDVQNLFWEHNRRAMDLLGYT